MMRIFVMTTVLCGLATVAQAGTMSTSATAPTIDGADIAMLNTSGEFDAGGDDGHIWSNRPVQGQTFTTMGNPGGYELTSVTLRNLSNNVNNNTDTWTIRIGTVAGNTFTPIASETSSNSISYTSGDYLTFTFDSAVSLSANTLYGFDWGTSGSGFVTANNADSNYAGGTNFRSGANSVPDDASLLFPGSDRVFHVAITSIPEPIGVLLLTVGLIGLGMARRRLR